MFQLRFLIGSPRKMSAHIFCHREYRGQRTMADDFHPAFNTYVCQPKGEPGTPGYKSSYDVMLELMQHSAQHQPGAQLYPIVELFHSGTRERLKLAGDEIILRPADFAAAQNALNTTQPQTVILTQVMTVDAVNQVSEVTNSQPPNSAEPISVPQEPEPPSTAQPSTPAPSVLDRVRSEIQTNGKATATQLSNTLGIDPSAIKDAVASEGSGLQNKGGWISLIPVEN